MQDTPPPLPERILESTLFASRWILAPIYLGLAVSLLLVLTQFAIKAAGLAAGILHDGTDELIIGVLSLIDLSLVANLVLIVVWAGYENFVSDRAGTGARNRPDWISHIGYSDLKLKLLTSIIAISAIHVLEDFMHLDSVSDRDLRWAISIHLMFVASAVMLAVMDWLASRAK